ncbi:hypothetical protein LWI28_023911 [Acer negundo]|uniref:Uncharacterized protein n=1 Tax=Acer negundo TaxID=4023 RepID=A0AAD5J780_ACENE|nr:hypothetical protein LWI28_023911 [Acer negundo]
MLASRSGFAGGWLTCGKFNIQQHSQEGIDVRRGGGNWLKISISDVVLGDMRLRRGYEVPGDGKITFLPAQIDKLSNTTQIIGLSISILFPVVLFLRFKFGKEHDHHDSGDPEIKGKSISIQVFVDFVNRISSKQSRCVNVLTTSLTLLVVGFAEGVPFIVTLTIIYWNKKALCDKGYVKESLACVGMGSVTTICTGKTGGLTLSSEAVEVLWIDEQVISEETVIDTSVVEALCNGISALGNSIENPFLPWATSKFGLELEILKKSCNIIDSKEIGSWKEGSRLLIRRDIDEESHMYCLHLSGSAKTILAMSSLYYDCKRTVTILDENKRSAFHQNIQHMQSKNLKTVGFADKMVDNYPNFEGDNNLILIGLIVEVLWIDEQVISEETVIDTSVVEALCNGISALGSSIGNPFLQWATSKLGLELEILKKSCNIIDSKEIGSWKEGSRVLMRRNIDEESHMYCLHWIGSAKTILAMPSLYYDCKGTVKILDENKSPSAIKTVRYRPERSARTPTSPLAIKTVEYHPEQRAGTLTNPSAKSKKSNKLMIYLEPTESTDHSQVSIDVSFDDDNGIPDDEKHLCPRRIHKEEHAPAQGFLEKIKGLPKVTSKSSSSSLDHGDFCNKSSSTSHRKKWRKFLVIHRASQFIVSSSKDQKASHENVGCAEDITGEPTEIVQVLPTSTDHSQVSIDISSDASNDDVNENLKLQHEGVAKIVKSGDLDSLQRFGGVNGISQALRTDLHKGIPGDEKDLCSRRHIDNNIKHPPAAQCLLKVTNEPAGKITFLPAQIDKLSNTTQIIGLSISILMLVVVFLRFKFGKEHDHHDSGAPEIKGKSISIHVFADFINRISSKQSGCVNVLTTSLTLLVVGFAEGVPFIVTLAIIYWNKKALCDKGYVIESLACVGMGSVTTICTGKTGGLTLSSEVVEELWIDEQVISEGTVIDKIVVEALCNGISALVLMLQSPGSSIGNPFLPWATSKLGLEPEILKQSCTIVDSKEISSWKQGSQVLMRRNGDEESHVCLHRSGSAKTILAMSSLYYDSKGTVNMLDEHKRSAFHQNIQHMQSKDLKTVAFAHKMVDNYPNFEGDNSLILIGLIEIAHKLVGNANLNGEQWGICVLIGMLSLLSDFAAKSISTLFKYWCLTVRRSHTDSAGMTNSSEYTSNLELPLINSESQIP